MLHNDLICPPAVEPVLRELCSSFEHGTTTFHIRSCGEFFDF
jgi:hypothetical protein